MVNQISLIKLNFNLILKCIYPRNLNLININSWVMKFFVPIWPRMSNMHYFIPSKHRLSCWNSKGCTFEIRSKRSEILPIRCAENFTYFDTLFVVCVMWQLFGFIYKWIKKLIKITGFLVTVVNSKYFF